MLKLRGTQMKPPLARGLWLIIIVNVALYILNCTAVNALLNVLVTYYSVTSCYSKVLYRFPLVLTLICHLLYGNNDCSNDTCKTAYT